VSGCGNNCGGVIGLKSGVMLFNVKNMSLMGFWQVSIASLVPSFKNFWAAPQQYPSLHSGLGS